MARVEPPAGVSAHDRRRCLLLLGGIAVVFFVAAVTLVDVSRYLVFDEAIYLSEVQRGAEGISFASHRARGITWLIAPVAGVGGSITAVRLWLAVLSAAGLWLAFRPWVASVGVSAPAAAAVYASTWTVVMGATDILPNLLTALAGVGATGYAFQPPRRTRRQLVGVFVAMALMAMLRPSETVWLGAFFAVTLPFRRRRGLAVLISAGAGTAVGWVPWIVEAYLRFEGPVQRYRSVQERIVDVDFWSRIVRYLRAADGPIYRGWWDTTAVPDGPVASAVVIWALLLLALIVLGAARPRPSSSAAAVRAAAVAGFVSLMSYVVLNGSVYARFVLPAWALATVPIGEALVGLVRRRRGRSVVIGVGVLALLWCGSQLATLRSVGGTVAEAEHELGVLARAVAPLVEEPCYLLAESGYAQLGFGAGCLSDSYAPDEDPPFRVDPARRAAGGRNVYALGRARHPAMESWRSQPVPGHPGWMLYQMPEPDPPGAAASDPR